MTYNQCSKISQSTSKLTWWVVFVRDSQAFFKKKKKQNKTKQKTGCIHVPIVLHQPPDMSFTSVTIIGREEKA